MATKEEIEDALSPNKYGCADVLLFHCVVIILPQLKNQI